MNDRELGLGWRAQITKTAIARGVSAVSALQRQFYERTGRLAGLTETCGIAYGERPEQKLDVWARRDGPPLRPAVLFFHGGGFQHLDPGSHWSFAERFAEAGAVVFNAGYRLAPRHRYPAAADDADLALRWVRAHALDYGADPERIIVSGTSAGGNLALGLTIVHPASVGASVLFSGLLQVSDMPRLYRGRRMSNMLKARCASIDCDYPPNDRVAWRAPSRPDPRFDPLLWLERQERLSAFAPTFVSTGSTDQVLEDSLRLRACLEQRGAPVQLDVVQGAGHSFQGFTARASVRVVWERCFAFLKEHGLMQR